MVTEWIELARRGRAVLVQQPARRFPSVCIQGDTLYLWLREIAETLGKVATSEREQLFLHGCELYGIVEGYVEACHEGPGRVPFEWPDPIIEREHFRTTDPSSGDG